MENNFYIIDPYLCLCDTGEYNLVTGPTGPTGAPGLQGHTGASITGSTGSTGYTQSPSGINTMSVGGYLVVGSSGISTGPTGLTGTRLFTDLTQGISTLPINYYSVYYADPTGISNTITYNATSYYNIIPNTGASYIEGGNGCITVPQSNQFTLNQPGVYHISLNYTWIVTGIPVTIYLNTVPAITQYGMSYYQTGTIVHAINILERVAVGQSPRTLRFELVGGGTGTPTTGTVTVIRNSFYVRRLN